jgi:hypothetical protein
MKIPKRLRAKAKEDYPLPKLLEDIAGSITHVFGLNLSLIEKANLKRIALQVYEDRDRLLEAIDYDFCRMQVELFQVKAETTCRFMMNYYSLPRELANINCSRSPRLADVVIHSNYQGFEDY